MIFLIILGIVLLIIIVGSFFLFRLALSRNTKKDFVLDNKLNQSHQKRDLQNEEKLKIWFDDLKEEVYLTNKEKLRLYGAMLKQQKSKKWILVIHGFTSSHLQMLKYAKKFYELGFNVLLIDLRAHGQSEGKYIGMGVTDRLDIKEWLDLLIEQEHPSSIGLFGVSMGAAAVMTSLGLILPKEVKFAIEDCGYSSVWEEFSYQLKHLFHLPVFPFLYLTELYAMIIAKYDFHTYSSKDSLQRTDIPILMIHGTKDTFVPFKMLQVNYDNCHSQKEKLEVKNASHCGSLAMDSKRYWETIEKFLKKYE